MKINDENLFLKQQILKLVDERSSEVMFLKLLRENLSTLGKCFSDHPDEYICFSEFPVGSGVVDFVVFYGRSRMQIKLIEIKGADFCFMTHSSYKNVSAKINEAAQQIRNRFSYHAQNGNEFRKFTHEIRQDVERGKQRFNSVHGPKMPLQADANKEINVYGAVIGGYSRDDIKESQLRNDLENSTLKIQFESWNSWADKLIALS